MRSLYSLPENENIPDTLDKYHLLLAPSQDFDSLDKIAEFVFESCKQYFPENITNLLKHTIPNEYNLFKIEMEKHLITSFKLNYLHSQRSFIASNHKALTLLIKNLEMLDHSVNSENMSRYLNRLNCYIGPQFNLDISSNKTQIANFASNFLLFMTINHSLFKRFNEDKLQGVNELLHCQQIYIRLINKFSEFSDIEYYFFERTFNIDLIAEIIKFAKLIETNDTTFDKSKRDLIYNHLGLACLLPNISSRGKTLETLLKSELIIIKNENESIVRLFSFLKKKDVDFSLILESVDNMILQIALITIPLMEMYFNYLCQSKEILNKELLQTNDGAPKDFKKDYPDIKAFTLVNKAIKSITQKYKDEKLEQTLEAIDFEYKAIDEDSRDVFDLIITELPENKIHNLVNEIKSDIFEDLFKATPD